MIIKNDTWKVYLHIFPDTTIYIGITSYPLKDRWREGRGYKGQKVYELIQQYDWNTEIEHILFASNLTKEEASNMEKLLIAKMREISPFQVRYNIADGGYDNVLQATKVVSQYDLDGNLIATYQSMTDAANATVGYNNIGLISRVCHNEYGKSGGYQFRFGDKEKIEPLTYNIAGTPVDQFDLNGNYIMTYNNASQAEKALKLERHVSDCCAGKRKLCGPYQWKYHEDNPHCEPLARRKSARIIDQYTLDDEYIQTWVGLEDLQKLFNLANKPTHILDVCNGKRNKAYGYKWKFNPDDNVIENKRRYSLAVNQYDLNGNFIQSYNTIVEAAKNFNNRKYAIYDCCTHKSKTAYGYKWEFKEEK